MTSTQLITMRQTTAVEPTYAAYSLLNEDVVRAGILSALALLKETQGSWLELISTAKTTRLHIEEYLNDELTALFHGTFVELEQKRIDDGRKRYANAAR